MATRISFADLTHTGQVVAANTFPLGSGMVVAYAKSQLGNEIDIEIFKYPDDLAAFLDRGMPDIACFTSFSWNIRLNHEYARRIKEVSPKTITIFGGCNFPDARDEQAEYLRKYSAIDFYIEFEGELAFVELYIAIGALLTLLDMLRLLGLVGYGFVAGAILAGVVTAAGAVLMLWGAWQEYQLTAPGTRTDSAAPTTAPPPTDNDDVPPA